MITSRSDAAREAAPYFDALLACLEEKEPLTTAAFGRHVHWGYWCDPAAADGTPSDYGWAAELLCRRVCDAASIRDGLRILDVGCGLGGTIASLNERFRNLNMVGVNIDQRQLDRAAAEVHPLNGNRIRFVQGDALDLGFEADSFDVVLAVECIFHFDDRARFFGEVGRVLVPGGTFALSDFVPPEKALPLLRAYGPSNGDDVRRAYGKIDVLCSLDRYRQLADSVGMDLVGQECLTKNIMPTYSFLRSSARTWMAYADVETFDRATARLEMACRTGLLQYTVLGFSKRHPS